MKLFKLKSKHNLLLFMLCLGLAPVSQAASLCTDAIKILVSGAKFKNYEDVNQRIGALEFVRKRLFLDEHKPYDELLAKRDLINSKDRSVSDLGSFKKTKQKFTDSDGKRRTRSIEVFEYKSGKDSLFIKLPIAKDEVEVATYLSDLDATFSIRDTRGIVHELWNGQPVILLTYSDEAALEMAKTTDIAYFKNQMDRLVAFTKSIDGDLNNLLDNPNLLPSNFDSTYSAPSLDELKLSAEFLAKLDGANSGLLKAVDEFSQVLDGEYRKLSLEFIFTRPLPGSKDITELARIETKLRNGQIEFGDGDLYIKLLSERPYQLWVKENEGIEYVIEKSSMNAKKTKILFGPKMAQDKVSSHKGSVAFDGKNLLIEGDVQTYDIGRLKFPLELIQVRLSE